MNVEKRQRVVIVGARGLGKEVLGYLSAAPGWEPVGFIDDALDGPVAGLPVFQPAAYDGECRNAVMAIGYPAEKSRILTLTEGLGLNWLTFVDPRAAISPFAELGQGCVVAPFAVVAGDARIERFVLVNAHSAVGHDTRIGERCSLMPGTIICGGAQIGEDTVVSVGATVLPAVTVGPRCTVSAQSSVSRTVPAEHIAFGNPAKEMPDISWEKRRRK